MFHQEEVEWMNRVDPTFIVSYLFKFRQKNMDLIGIELEFFDLCNGPSHPQIQSQVDKSQYTLPVCFAHAQPVQY